MDVFFGLRGMSEAQSKKEGDDLKILMYFKYSDLYINLKEHGVLLNLIYYFIRTYTNNTFVF